MESHQELLGIHHITAMCGDPQANVDFYCGVLGLRLVKVTINYDDPGTYHLYYGDGLGRPGSLYTTFPWPSSYRGTPGLGQVESVAYSVPKGAHGFWKERLTTKGIPFTSNLNALNESVLSLADPDGITVEIIESANDGRSASAWDGLGDDVAIRGFHSAGIASARPGESTQFLINTLGFREIYNDGETIRFEVGAGGAGTYVDIIDRPGRDFGRMGGGTVHHIAFRTESEQMSEQWRQIIVANGRNVTPIVDRNYFKSLYFREPGGVLYELATDPPGMTYNESLDQLGSGLMLPPWLEERRDEIESVLPTFTSPAGVHFPR